MMNYSAQMENFAKVQEQLETIIKVQLHPNIDNFEAPNSFGIYKASGGNALGVVGKDFTPAQPKLILDSLLDCSLDLSKLTYHEMKGGSKVRFQIPLKTIEFKNKANKGDVTDVSLCIQTGFDGFTKTSWYLHTERLICTNGMKATMTEFFASFKNTVGNQGKVVGVCTDVAKAVGKLDDLKELYLNLNRVEINQGIVDDYLLKVANLDVKQSVDWSTRKKNIYDNIMASIDLEFGRTGTTAFGLLNGITHYTNHVASGSDNPDYIFVDSGAKMNDKALAYVTELVY